MIRNGACRIRSLLRENFEPLLHGGGGFAIGEKCCAKMVNSGKVDGQSESRKPFSTESDSTNPVVEKIQQRHLPIGQIP